MQLRVLVVDDEPEVVNAIKALVERLGCGVVATTDSEQAAECLKKEQFDGVFLDVRMPKVDGLELARRVRKSYLNGSVPIVMFTGLDDVATMREGFKAGATCFLGKPVSADRVTNLLKAMRSAMLVERRRHARLPLRTTVTCTAGNHHLTASSVNISESGMVLDASGGLEVSNELTLEFLLPKASVPTRVRARVIYKEPSDCIAVEFLDLSKTDREVIESYITGAVTP